MFLANAESVIPGLLGLGCLLLIVVVWLVHRLLAVIDRSNRIIAANTHALEDLATVAREQMKLTRWLVAKAQSNDRVKEAA
jgi:hypothetical protein